ncbi:MAG: class I adenylate-forming enzyme family protein [Halieaceae bacterium]|nr:class I adenylate-forming enzyme family protein [Halieaceae bacterium]
MKNPGPNMQDLSLVHGVPLSEETGIGALTLGGYLRDVTEHFGPREAAVLREGSKVERWTYHELWARSTGVARALIACGIGKGARVGILMTNRLEFLSSFFGAALAGGVATPMSTFSTAAELDVLLKNSACSVLLIEGNVLSKDFAEMLKQLEPRIADASPGSLYSLRFPFLRHLAMVDAEQSRGAIESWPAFLDRGATVAAEYIDATADSVTPADPGVLFFSSGSTGKPKGILSAHRGACLQLWRWPQWYEFGDDVRCWSANGFFWSGNFAMAIGGALASGGSLVLQRTFLSEEALELMDAERVTYPFAWPHQWAQLTGAKNWLDVDLSSLKYVDANCPITGHPTVRTTWLEPSSAYGNTEAFTLISVFPANTPSEVHGGSHGLPVPGSSIKIVEPFEGHTLVRGESGEIAQKGANLMLGYVGIPLQETLDEEGFFHTGDGGFIDEQGRLHWQGRLNNIIKTGGANVSPLEVDAVIATCPGVKITQTIGVADELLGELVVSCIVAREGAELTANGVREFARQTLASYKAPRQVLFFDESEIELTGSAKVKTEKLRELAAKRLLENKD